MVFDARQWIRGPLCTKTYIYNSDVLRAGQAGEHPYTAFDVVVVAASAGGIEALSSLLRTLPCGFSTPIVVVVHLPRTSMHVSRLANVLQRKTWLEVKWAEDGECLLPGKVYVAPQDRCTIVDPETGRLVVSSIQQSMMKVPAADPLFSSAAQAFGSRSLAVVLSGVLSDGAAGCAMIARAGGRVLAQSASEARFADMPIQAMRRSQVGLAFDSKTLAHVIASLVMNPGAAAWFAIGMTGVCAQLLTTPQ